MKHIDSNQKTHQQNVHTVDQSPSAGLNGMAVMPPAYGMDFVNRRYKVSTGRALQTKLAINQPRDEYEQEADRIANQVMTSPAHHAPSIVPLHIQRFAGQSIEKTDTAPASVDQALATSGKPLDPTLQHDMEQRFDYDFSQVRVHTGAVAEQSAQDVNARAYTVGQDIVFDTGRFAPRSYEGRRLIAHELTHTIQQKDASGNLHRGAGTVQFYKTSQAILQREERTPIRVMERRVPIKSMERRIPIAPRGGLLDDLMGVAPGLFGAVGMGVALAQNSEVVDTIAGGLMGEFNEDPSFAMIGVDLGVSLIPVLDQASDIRDIIAHLYYMIVKNQYDRFMRWIGLAFTLIGAFPEAGSLIKGASKFIIKGAREVISHLDELLNVVRKILPKLGDLRHLQNYIAKNWNKWEAIGKSAWNLVLDRVSVILSAARFTIGGVMGQAQAVLTKIRKKAQDLLPIAFNWMKHKIDNVLEEVVQHPTRPSAAPGLGEIMIKEEKRTGLNVDLAAQEHRHKKDFREGSGKDVQSAHMVNSSSVSDISDYVRDSALTVLLPKNLHKAFDDYWKNWARNRLAKAKPGEEVKITVAEWEKVLNDAADSVVDLKGRTADTMSFMIRTELYQTLGLKPDQLIRLPFSK